MTLILTALGAKAATSLKRRSYIPTNIIFPPLTFTNLPQDDITIEIFSNIKVAFHNRLESLLV